MLASSTVIRRQQFLIRSLGGGGYNHQNQAYCRIRQIKSASTSSMEVDAENIVRTITPTLDPNLHKGQAGKVAVIGGCREYTGAPYFAAISALKLGADLSHVFCTKDAAAVIKSYSPELIVHPVLQESYSVRDEERRSVSSKVLAEVAKWMERFDCLVVGPGLGRDPFLLLVLHQIGIRAELLGISSSYYSRITIHGLLFTSTVHHYCSRGYCSLLLFTDCVGEIVKHARQLNVPIVIDGDGLFLVTNSIDLVSGYPLAVLTPNVNEYKRLVQKVLDSEVNDQDSHQQLLSLAKSIGGATILRKGKSDLISDGETVSMVSIFGSPRRCGGQGDILSGSVAVFSSWARQSSAARNSSTSLSNPMVLGCIAASALLRKAASVAFENKKRATLTTDIIEQLGKSLDDICPAC